MKKQTCVKQHDIKDCGVACLATIFKHFGAEIPLAKIRSKALTDNKGTNFVGLEKAALAFGCNSKAVKGDREALLSNETWPVIAHVIIDNSLEHYVVIHGLTNGHVVVADPGEGLKKVRYDDFFSMWTGYIMFITPNKDFRKGNQKVGLLSLFKKLLKPQKKTLAAVLILSLIVTATGILGTFYFKVIIDDVIPGASMPDLWTVSSGFLVLAIIKIVINRCRQMMMLKLSKKIDLPVNVEYFEHVIDLPMKFFDDRRTGEITSRLSDAAQIKDAVSNTALTVMIDLVMFVAGGIILANLSLDLFIATIIIASTYAVIVFLFNKPIRKVNKELMEKGADVESYFIETINGVESIKAFNVQESIKSSISKKLKSLLNTMFNAGRIHTNAETITQTIYEVGGIAILLIGAIKVITGTISAGELLAFNALIIYFLEPFKNIIDLQPQLQAATVASDRLYDVLYLEKEVMSCDGFEKKKGASNNSICFDNVHFKYGAREDVLRNINLQIEAGEKVAIIGESGSGKTTLVKLIMGFYEINKGKILVGDKDISEIGRANLRNIVAYVSQDIFFYNDTIMNNLTMFNPEAGREEVIDACKKAFCHDFIMGMYAGYDSFVEENGANLSYGQRQRLAIARAFLKKPKIVIMDEATSNLDSISENAVLNTLKCLPKDVTVIIIAHRLNTINKCDRIIVMDKGRIVEEGQREELIRKQSKLQQLVNGYQ